MSDGLIDLALVGLTHADGVVTARRVAREAAAALGFEAQDQTRLATAISELARNAHQYARGGRLTLSLALPAHDRLVCVVRDEGPGIADVRAALTGGTGGEPAPTHGLLGVQRLVDAFALESGPSGTTVTVAKDVPRATPVDVAVLRESLQRRTAADTQQELEQQNRELLQALGELHLRQRELMALNAELDETNRGVVALHHELEQQAARDRTISRLLQRSLMPERLARVDGVTVTASHRSAGRGALVGGDFYDTIDVADDELWIVIGDVAGHGVETAAKANELRQSMRVYAREGFSPVDALARLNALVLADDLVPLATACLLRVRPGDGTAEVLIAGHPPPVLAAPGLPATFLEERRGPVLGIAGARWVPSEHHLPTRARLALYTDGLIERPGEALDEGFARLLLACDELPPEAPAATERLFSLLPPDQELRDDVAVMLVDIAG